MKDQYFGDVNDYVKYGLLRALVGYSGLSLGVAWMRTGDDGGRDGRRTGYLLDPDRWRAYDPPLFDALRGAVVERGERRISLAWALSLLPGAAHHDAPVPVGRSARHGYLADLSGALADADLVFLDPDNGLEVPSVPLGRTAAVRYVYWHEVAALAAAGSSLLVYQHFPRVSRDTYLARACGDLAARTGCATWALSTPRVAFLLAAREGHREALEAAVVAAAERWSGALALAPLPPSGAGR